MDVCLEKTKPKVGLIKLNYIKKTQNVPVDLQLRAYMQQFHMKCDICTLFLRDSFVYINQNERNIWRIGIHFSLRYVT